MTGRQLHARRAAAVRWGHHAEARELGREMAEERAAAALRILRGYAPLGHGTLARLRRLLDGTPHPGD